MRPLIQQFFHPEKDICLQRAGDLFGHDWRKKLRASPQNETERSQRAADINAMQKVLKETVHRAIQRIDLKVSPPAIATLVYTAAIYPERDIIVKIMKHLRDGGRTGVARRICWWGCFTAEEGETQLFVGIPHTVVE